VFGVIELIQDLLFGQPTGVRRRLAWLLGWVVAIVLVLVIVWAIAELV
jgi:hypothetical protein